MTDGYELVHEKGRGLILYVVTENNSFTLCKVWFITICGFVRLVFGSRRI